jgi:hypothetical protein
MTEENVGLLPSVCQRQTISFALAAWNSCDLDCVYLTPNTTTTVLSMEQKKAPSASALLSKQLENISDTLSKASQRRDTELQQRRGSKSTIFLRKSNQRSPASLAAISSDQRSFEPLKKDMAPVKAKGLSASVHAASPTKSEQIDMLEPSFN